MPYWMTNPEHGVMTCYDMGEVERAKVHGWSLLNEGVSPIRAQQDPQEVLEEVRETIKELGKRKPGRPPKAKQ